MSTYYSGGAGNSGSGNRSSSGAVGSTSGPGGPPTSGQAPRPKTKGYGSMMDRYLHDTTTQISDRYSGHQDPIDDDRHRSEVLQRKERREKEAERLARIAKGSRN